MIFDVGVATIEAKIDTCIAILKRAFGLFVQWSDQNEVSAKSEKNIIGHKLSRMNCIFSVIVTITVCTCLNASYLFLMRRLLSFCLSILVVVGHNLQYYFPALHKRVDSDTYIQSSHDMGMLNLIPCIGQLPRFLKFGRICKFANC